MKTKYLIVAALCCIVMVACQSNDPDKNTGNDNKTNNEVIEGLNDLIDGIGNIVDTKTLEDGSIVMTDDKGNTITKDKEGNITIVTKEGETILIDNSIKEDPSAAKDKWYNSTWRNNNNHPESPEMYEEIPEFISRIQTLRFHVEQKENPKDTTIIEQENENNYIIHFRNTTASLQQIDTVREYTYTRRIQYLKITLFPEEIGNEEHRYELVIENNHAVLYEKYYYYDNSTETYVLDGEWIIDSMDRYWLNDDNSFTFYQGTTTLNPTERIISTNNQTTYFNYRRLSETQIAASNNSVSYIINERTDQGTPKLEVNDLQGNKLISLELVSL